MADKSFEQQVMEQLAGLKMKPDAAVWPEIEKELHKGKKRRWIIWFFLFGGLGLASFFSYQYYNGQQGSSAKNSRIDKTLEAKNDLKKEEVITHSPVQQRVDEVMEKNTGEIAAEQLPVPSNEQAGKTKAHSINTKKSSLPQTQALPTVVSEPADHVVAETPEPVIKNTDRADALVTITKEESLPKPKASENTKPAAKGVTIDNEFINAKPAGTDSIITDNKNESAKTVTITQGKKKKNDWQLFGSVDLGRSGSLEGISFGTKAYASVAPPNAGSSGSFYSSINSQTPTTTFKTPGKEDAFSFGLNIHAIKPLGKRKSIGFSAGYGLYRSVTSVGRRIDSTMTFSATGRNNENGSFYLSTNTNQYTNHYHFAELGVDLYTQYKLANALSLRWRLGMGASVLLSSNALLLDDATGLLYANRSLLTDVQMNFSGGVDLGIGKNQGFYIGPGFTYFLSRRSSLSTENQHIFRAGIRAGILLSGKKK